MTTFHPIIPAGGAGTRLWPLSRRKAPKFLLDLTGAGSSLLEQTVSRLQPLTDGDMTVVCGTDHAGAVTDLVGDQCQVVAEPSPRNSMPAIGLAAAIIAQTSPEAIIGSFAADHLITDETAFHNAVRTGIAAAKSGDLVTIGITPTSPATGYGYIEKGGPHDVGGASQVANFREKPDYDTARSWVDAGTHLWNAGMFICRADVLLDMLATEQPSMAGHLDAIARAWHTDHRQAAIAEHWTQVDAIAIDYALAEPMAAAGRVAVVPADMGWADLGDADAVATHTAAIDGLRRPPGQAGRMVAVDSPDSYIHADRAGVIAVVGVPNAVVIDTGDVLMVTTRDRAQDVRSAVDILNDEGLADFT